MPYVAFFAIALLAAPSAADVRPSLPFSDVEVVVERYFRILPGYRPGDLITREDVKPLLGQLERMGLPRTESQRMLDDLPANDEFLPEQFSTPAGRNFMRQIAKYIGAYDRLDRLSRLPRGQQTIRDLIRGPDGYKMLQYMTTAPGGRVLGEQLSDAPGAGDFNAPTGRIYTVDTLLKRLERVFRQARNALKRP
jgi:hypothetical protein